LLEQPSAYIAQLSSTIYDIASEYSLSTPIPSCPEWTLGDLVAHLGAVHHFWTIAVEQGTTDALEEPSLTYPDDEVLVEWAREQCAHLLHAFARHESLDPCWTWWGSPMTVGAVERHQVQEALIHAWDAANAVGVAFTLPLEPASDGIAEFLAVHAEVVEGALGTRAVTLELEDAATTLWAGTGESVVTVTGTSADILLALHQRVVAPALHVDGDATCWDALRTAADLR
jgi:uncharacterized protein (TIGR03083 family)